MVEKKNLVYIIKVLKKRPLYDFNYLTVNPSCTLCILCPFDLYADKSVAEAIRARSAGDCCASDPSAVDAGPIGHDVLHGKRRVFGGRRSHRGAYTATRCHRTRSLPARRRVEGRDRGQPEKGIQVDTQLQNTVGQNRVLHQNAEQH